jgi:hypothetical protein
MIKRGASYAYISPTAQAFVLYKYDKVHTLGLIKLGIYLLYLLCLNTYSEPWMMILFLVYFTIMNVIKLSA